MRPALADVIAATTADGDRRLAEFWRVELRPFEPPARITKRVEVTERGVATFDVIETAGGHPRALPAVALQWWAHPSPAEALAALVEAELLPAHWCDPERAPRWWCEACEGRGHACCRCATPCGPSPFDFVSDGATAAPPSRAALVAVASLGADDLARAEAIVAERWRARVVWRVERPHERRKRLRARRREMHLDSSPEVFAAAEAWREWPSGAWPEECPAGFLGLAAPDAEAIRRAWPALRALAALGLHLLAVGDGRVTLAVEALDG